MDYETFLDRKSQIGKNSGFEPLELPDALFPFQRHMVTWAIRKGRAAILADCGAGKTLMELVYANNVALKTGKPVLIAAPLAVASQFMKDAEKFGIDAVRSQDGQIAGRIVVTNYERLDRFDCRDFGGMVCDEASILKSYTGATRKQITRFMAKLPYRLGATATAAPNDWVELGTLSEALGDLSHSEMLRRFFKYLDDKGQKSENRLQQEAENLIASNPNYFKKLSFRVSQTIGQWRLKHHAADHFWRWVASWAMAMRTPSDIGFSNDGFVLPPLTEKDHIIIPKPKPGHLFNVAAIGIYEEREERKRTLNERCEYAAALVNHDDAAVIWCDSNDEGNLLEKIIPGAAQIAGKTPDERKIELYDAFASGQLKKLVIKPKIGAWGLNWQHCNHVVGFASHSYERHYQRIRRCWRFGQKRPVTVDTIATEGESRVLSNMRSKGHKADEMFTRLVAEMNNATTAETTNHYVHKMSVPTWL